MTRVIIKPYAVQPLPGRKQLRLATVDSRSERMNVALADLDADYSRHLRSLEQAVRLWIRRYSSK